MTAGAKALTRFGQYVLDQMTASGFRKQSELARAAGVSDSTVSRWLYSEGRPDPRSLERLAPAIGVDYSELLVFANRAADPADDPEPPVTADEVRRAVKILLDHYDDPDTPEPERLMIRGTLTELARLADPNDHAGQDHDRASA